DGLHALGKLCDALLGGFTHGGHDGLLDKGRDKKSSYSVAGVEGDRNGEGEVSRFLACRFALAGAPASAKRQARLGFTPPRKSSQSPARRPHTSLPAPAGRRVPPSCESAYTRCGRRCTPTGGPARWHRRGGSPSPDRA